MISTYRLVKKSLKDSSLFISWVAQQPTGAIVGRAGSSVECPIANFFVSKFPAFKNKFCVANKSATSFTARGQAQFHEIPVWASNFIIYIDSKRRIIRSEKGGITALTVPISREQILKYFMEQQNIFQGTTQ